MSIYRVNEEGTCYLPVLKFRAIITTIIVQKFRIKGYYFFKYIRLCPNTKLELVWDILTKHWELSKPKLLISVTGSTSCTRYSLRSVLAEGIAKAATLTGTCI